MLELASRLPPAPAPHKQACAETPQDYWRQAGPKDGPGLRLCPASTETRVLQGTGVDRACILRALPGCFSETLTRKSPFYSLLPLKCESRSPLMAPICPPYPTSSPTWCP